MNQETKETLRAVIRTLEGVSVQGKYNLDGVLACILALEKLVEQADKQEE